MICESCKNSNKRSYQVVGERNWSTASIQYQGSTIERRPPRIIRTIKILWPITNDRNDDERECVVDALNLSDWSGWCCWSVIEILRFLFVICSNRKKRSFRIAMSWGDIKVRGKKWTELIDNCRFIYRFVVFCQISGQSGWVGLIYQRDSNLLWDKFGRWVSYFLILLWSTSKWV